MTDPIPESPTPDSIVDQVTDLMCRLQAEPDSESIRSEIAAWVSASEINARAWVVAEETWRVAGRARPRFAHEWPPKASARSLSFGGGAAHRDWLGAAVRRAPIRVPHRRWRNLGFAAVGLAACLVFALVLPGVLLRFSADYMTATAESRQITLEDGSIVHLGAASAIATKYTGERRQVTLLRGEAFFEVTPDRSRPFSVRADDLTVTVTGTAFDVGFTDRAFSVAVARGAVDVSRGGRSEARHVSLGPGQRLTIKRQSDESVESKIPVELVAPWRKGRLVFDDVALVDAVAAVGRYHGGMIVVADSRLRASRVTGVFDLTDPVRALRVMSAANGGTAREITPYLVLITGD